MTAKDHPSPPLWVSNAEQLLPSLRPCPNLFLFNKLEQLPLPQSTALNSQEWVGFSSLSFLVAKELRKNYVHIIYMAERY